MINYFTGKPGNGKSLHMAEIIYNEMRKGKNVIANFEINESYFDKCKPEKVGKFIYMPNFYWLNNAYKGTTAVYRKALERNSANLYDGVTGNRYSYLDGLYNFALMYHKRKPDGRIIEHQTLLVIDECQELFNTRAWNRADRLEWAAFFREHRKLGFDVYLISQDDKVIDKQIRNVLQFEYEHRALKYYKWFGKLLSFLAGGNLFVCIKKNYSMKNRKDAHISSTYFKGKKKFYNFYDSYATFHAK